MGMSLRWYWGSGGPCGDRVGIYGDGVGEPENGVGFHGDVIGIKLGHMVKGVLIVFGQMGI